MNRCCLLNLLPVELLHDIFTYFWAHEIFQSFSNVSDHIDSVLLNYSAYRVNFQQILKKHFDLVCDSIRPDQIIALTVSDEKYIGQSELLFSRFQLEQFIQLQSLTLIEIEDNGSSLQLMINSLTCLPRLHSLTLNTQQLTQILDFPTEIFSQLNRLNSNEHIDFEDKSLINLTHLNLSSSYFLNEIQTICEQAINMRSLNIHIMLTASDGEFFLFQPQLVYLTLTIQTRTHANIFLSMNDMECLLTNLPCLKHFELHANGLDELANGQRWQMLTHSLTTFHFNLNIELMNLNEVYNSFHTPFWIDEKQWFVAYYKNYLFSVPYFLHTHMEEPPWVEFYTTSNDIFIINENIKTLSLPINLNETEYHRCTQVENLELNDSISLEGLSNAVHLNKIKCLTLFSLKNIQALISLLQAMPHINKLEIKSVIRLNLFEISSKIQFKQIHTLIIRGFIFDDFNIESCCHLFPNVNHLTLAYLRSKAHLIRFLDGFTYLSYASFEIKSSCIEYESIEMIVRQARRLTNSSFTCRLIEIDNPNFVSSVNLWLGKTPSQSLWTKHWPLRRGYIWFRSKYILFYYSDLLISLIHGYLLYVSYSMEFYKINHQQLSRLFIWISMIFFILFHLLVPFFTIYKYFCNKNYIALILPLFHLIMVYYWIARYSTALAM